MTVVSFVYTECQALGAAHCFGFNMRGVWPFGRVRKVSLLVRDTSALDQNFLPLFRQVSTTVLIRMIRQTSCMSCESSHSGPSLSPAFSQYSVVCLIILFQCLAVPRSHLNFRAFQMFPCIM